jgi:hypothetical protein
MMTNHQIERLWKKGAYGRLVCDLLATRPEASLRLETDLANPAAAAALAVIRLDELNQSASPLSQAMLRQVLATQEPDGGWGPVLTTTLCLRALLGCNGSGLAVRKAMIHLAGLQLPDGLWPKLPFRAAPSDPFVSAFVIHQLGADPVFAAMARIPDALAWFAAHIHTLDAESARLWHAIARHSRRPAPSVSLAAAIAELPSNDP